MIIILSLRSSYTIVSWMKTMQKNEDSVEEGIMGVTNDESHFPTGIPEWAPHHNPLLKFVLA